MKRIHYAGAIEVPQARGKVLVVVAGWAACCAGPQAEQIKADGQHTYVRPEVTCKRCLALIARAKT